MKFIHEKPNSLAILFLNGTASITMIPIVRLALKVYEKSLSNKNVPCQLNEYGNPTQRVACIV